MTEKKENVASFILKALKKERIEYVFLVPGFVVDPFLLHFRDAGIEPIVAAHEGGAAYMADGYGRASQNFGVCLGIGGPGVTNMATALAAAYADRSPILAIAGRVPSDWEAKGTFQDSSGIGIDDIAVVRPITGFAATIPQVDEANIKPKGNPENDKAQDDAVNTFLRKAMRAIRDVESLPAFLSVPADVQEEDCIVNYEVSDSKPLRILDKQRAQGVIEPLCNNTRIAILAGNGSVRSGASKDILEFAEEYDIPVVTTMRGKGAVSEDNHMSFGVFGLGGGMRANRIVFGSTEEGIEKAEVLLVLGATLNENNTYLRDKDFALGKKLVIVDINPNSNRDVEYTNTIPIMADVKTMFEWLKEEKDVTGASSYHASLKRTQEERKKWLDKIRAKPEYDSEEDRKSANKDIHPARVIAELRQSSPNNSVLVVDSGAHTFFTGHNWKSFGPNEFFFLSTTGPMGYGIAMGIGAWLARRDRPCICVVGDGSMLMHGMELRTAVRYKIPLVVVVINNGSLGNVFLRFNKKRHEPAQQEAAKVVEITPPIEWAKFAQSVGAEGDRVVDPEDLAPKFEKAFRRTQETSKPFVLDILCDKMAAPPNQERPSAQRGLRTSMREKRLYNPYG